MSPAKRSGSGRGTLLTGAAASGRAGATAVGSVGSAGDFGGAVPSVAHPAARTGHSRTARSFLIEEVMLGGVCIRVKSVSLSMKHLLLLLALFQQDFKDELPRLKATEAADAIKTFKLQPGYRIELVAEEPLVSSPV